MASTASCDAKKRKAQERRDAYNANPNLCEQCGSPIVIKAGGVGAARNRQFCSRKCSGQHRRAKQTKLEVVYDAAPKSCKACGKPILRGNGPLSHVLRYDYCCYKCAVKHGVSVRRGNYSRSPKVCAYCGTVIPYGNPTDLHTPAVDNTVVCSAARMPWLFLKRENNGKPTLIKQPIRPFKAAYHFVLIAVMANTYRSAT